MRESYKILIVDDEVEYRETFRILLEEKGFIVEEAGTAAEALELLEREYYPIVLSDIIMPGKNGFQLLKEIKQTYKDSIQVIIVTGYGSIESAVEAMKMGASSYFIKSRNPEELFVEIEKAKVLVKLQVQKNIVKREFGSKFYINQTKSSKMLKTLEMIDAVSNSTSSVLLLGESGVGKEVLAHMIHDKSPRASMPFIPINCQAISDSLLESELFGHEKGAFTGAVTKNIGRFEEANGGSIFLDEIGEMFLNTQVKLLRVLDNKRIERIGSSKSIAVDFRLISATNRDIKQQIMKGDFREDLYYRINTITIDIPPLRERKEDIGDMIDFFVNRFSNEMKKEIIGVDSETMNYLLDYHYPGNVRELKNIIEGLVVLSNDGILRLSQFDTKAQSANNIEIPRESMSLRKARRLFEIEYIRNMLNQYDNNITQAANSMGISRRQLFNKLVEYNLKDSIH